MTVKAMMGAETRMAMTRVREVMVFSSAILTDRRAFRRRASRGTCPDIPARDTAGQSKSPRKERIGSAGPLMRALGVGTLGCQRLLEFRLCALQFTGER